MSGRGETILDQRSYSAIRFERRDDGVLLATMDRAHARNAMDEVLHGELARLFPEVEGGHRRAPAPTPRVSLRPPAHALIRIPHVGRGGREPAACDYRCVPEVMA